MVFVQDDLEVVVTCFTKKSMNWYSDCKRISKQPPQPFYDPFSGTPGWAGARRELLDFMVQRKINRADTL